MRAEDLVALAVSQGGLGNDALLAAVLPLFHATAEVHERGLVAPLRGLDRITVDEQTRLGFDPGSRVQAAAAPGTRSQPAEGHRADRGRGGRASPDRDGSRRERRPGPDHRSSSRCPRRSPRPCYVPGWQSWEHVVGHHDPLTDIFSLGQLLVAPRLRPRPVPDRGRRPADRCPRQPVSPSTRPAPGDRLGRRPMVEPDRHRRAQDLRSLIEQLENYRDQPLDFDVDRDHPRCGGPSCARSCEPCGTGCSTCPGATAWSTSGPPRRPST